MSLLIIAETTAITADFDAAILRRSGIGLNMRRLLIAADAVMIWDIGLLYYREERITDTLKI